MDQLVSGKLLGIEAERDPSGDSAPSIVQVKPNSWASENEIHKGQKLIAIKELQVDGPSPSDTLAAPVFEAMIQVGNRKLQVTGGTLPKRSVPVHPSQVYAAISGLVLCLWTILFSAMTKRRGMVIGAGLVAYGVQRIIEEIIRVDEAGQFGTSLSIAQWISIGGIVLGVGLMVGSKTDAIQTK
jgi:phosphatidylglycerol:prolipoprotein diacylglycerol transferase